MSSRRVRDQPPCHHQYYKCNYQFRLHQKFINACSDWVTYITELLVSWWKCSISHTCICFTDWSKSWLRSEQYSIINGKLAHCNIFILFLFRKNIFEPEPMKAGARENRQMQRMMNFNCNNLTQLSICITIHGSRPGC